MGETVVRHKEGQTGQQELTNAVNYEAIIRRVCKNVGYDDEKSKGLDYRTMTVLVNVVPQSQEIFDAVHKKKQKDDTYLGESHEECLSPLNFRIQMWCSISFFFHI